MFSKYGEAKSSAFERIYALWKIEMTYRNQWNLNKMLLEFFLGSNESNCTSVTSADSSKCPREDWTVQAIAAIYMLFSNFLLVNLVIAMFRFGIYRAILIHCCSYNAFIMHYLVKCFIYSKSSVNSIFFISIQYMWISISMTQIKFRV